MKKGAVNNFGEITGVDWDCPWASYGMCHLTSGIGF